jgi:hypothetical protein
MVLQKLRKVFEPVAMILILAGIIGMIQPIALPIFRWGFNILWMGLVAEVI